MIKYLQYFTLFLFILFLGFTSVSASIVCPNASRKELSKSAAFIKANYEVIDKSEEKELVVDGNKTTYRVPNYVFEFSIYNLTEKFYAEIKTTDSEGKSNSRRVYYDETTDGVYTFKDYNIGEIYNYVITIKSDDIDCTNRVFKTIKITKPRYNAYSEYTYCQNSSTYYCQKFISTEINIENTNEFLEKIKVNNERNNPKREEQEQKETIVRILKNNWKLYLIIFASVITVAVVVVLLIRRHNKKKGWKL